MKTKQLWPFTFQKKTLALGRLQMSFCLYICSKLADDPFAFMLLNFAYTSICPYVATGYGQNN